MAAMKIKCFFSAMILAIQVTPTFAGCDDVYQNNIRTKSFSESNYSSLNTVYDNLCSASGERKNSNWEASLGIIVDSLPINLKGGGSSAEEKALSFCRNYQKLRFDASHDLAAKDEVVVSALNTYNACKEIEARSGVIVTHKFADPDSIIVNFDFKNSATVLRIDGVLASNMVCQANGAPKKEKKLSQNSNFEMRNNFAITCSRTKQKNKAIYLPGSLAIGTNITSYTISMPADSIYNNSLASDATNKISGLEGSLVASQSQVTSLTSKVSENTKKLAGIRMVQHRVMVGQYNPGGGFNFYGCGTDLQMVKNSLCTGAIQSAIESGASRSGEMCGYGSFVVTCLFLGE